VPHAGRVAATVSTDPVERRERLARANAARAQRDRGVGFTVICVGLTIFLIPCLVVFVLYWTGVATSDLTGLVLLPAWFASTWVIKRGRRMRVAAGERVLAEDERAPIVFLRPFDADDSESDRSWSSRVRASPWERYITHEERLARTLRKVGPFVAVGDPTEELPQLGAARVYAADENWQATVDEWTARAGVLLLQTGESEGLTWEVQHVVALGTPERVILSLPPAGKRKGRSRQERYDAFRRRFGDVFPRGLPESIGHCLFAYFNSDWTPRLLGNAACRCPPATRPATSRYGGSRASSRSCGGRAGHAIRLTSQHPSRPSTSSTTSVAISCRDAARKSTRPAIGRGSSRARALSPGEGTKACASVRR
jgi:hypothetical protein